MSDCTDPERRTAPATLVVGRCVPDDQRGAYQEWHHRIDRAVRSAPGFVASELHTPIADIQEEWVHVLRFDSLESLQGWLQAPQRLALVEEGDRLFGADVHQQIFAGSGTGLPVTVTLSHRVRAGGEDAYRAWLAGIDRAAAQYPGFLGSERHDPVEGFEDDFIVVFRFDSQEHLGAWRDSDQRHKWMARQGDFIERTRERRMTGGFDTWFSAAETVATGQVPARWKQALTVLLGLYPTSMLFGHFVFPMIPGWPDPPAHFVGLMVSIITLTWVVMPLVTRVLAPWLDPVRGARPLVNIGGAVGVLAVYGVLVTLFSMIFR